MPGLRVSRADKHWLTLGGGQFHIQCEGGVVVQEGVATRLILREIATPIQKESLADFTRSPS